MEENLKKYFLGTLSPAESEAVEMRLISEAGFEEQMLLAKDNLMEDYLDDALSPAELGNFRQKFLNCERQVKELENLALLRNYARRHSSKEFAAGHKRKSSDSFFDGFVNFFKTNFHPLAAGFAAVILIAAFIGFVFQNSGSNELAALNDKNFENLNEYRNLTNLNLVSGTFRSSEKTVKLSAANLTDPVFLRLALPLEGEFFDVGISRGDENIITNLRTRAYQNQNGRELRLLIPASDLTKGVYTIKIFPADLRDKSVVFSFTVQ